MGDAVDRLFAIVEGGKGTMLDLCQGPTPEGQCPRADAQQTLPCAGARVMPLRGTPANRLPFSVQRNQQGPRCPLEWVDRVSE